jgi:DNA topoisomerase-1
MDTLVIAEKPSVALRLAMALGGGKQKRLGLNGVSYYQIDTQNGTIYIAAAVGHLFSLVQAERKSGYPVLEVRWAPSHESNSKADFTKKYLDVLEALAKKATAYVNACDYDTEGTVIGTNIIRYSTQDGLRHAKRMKFSTTTIPDLQEAYARLMPLDINNFYAGEARHTLDWLWGINFSRALTSAVSMPRTRALSIGRVQGPALAILAVREKEVSVFVPVPFWKLIIRVKEVDFTNQRGEIFDNSVAKSAYNATVTSVEGAGAYVELVDSKEQTSKPYPPFDLTTLQIEAARTLRYDPSVTLAIAQSLYERSYISYPRTSSQKLPPTLDLPKILGELAKNPRYAARAGKLVAARMFRPNEGAKQDEAHPAIYPTGVLPSETNEKEEALYNLVTERFLGCFAPHARLAKTKVVIRTGEERYSVDGTKIIEKGWLEFYTFGTLGEKIIPEFRKEERVEVSETEIRESKTVPPKRYTKASLIAELERRDLGTKATRAAIIDTLAKRAYIDGSPIGVTEFGMSVYEALHANVQMILDEETTRKLEKDMEAISQGKKTEQEVIEEGKRVLLDALRLFDSNKAKISEAMAKGLYLSSQNVLGKCPKDGGDLVVRKSRAGKQFAGCANYPKCTTTFSLPQGAKIVPTGKSCEYCHTPIIRVVRRAKRAFEMDLDPNCRTKESWRGKTGAVVGADAPQAPSAEPGKAAEAGKPLSKPAEVRYALQPGKKATKQARRPKRAKGARRKATAITVLSPRKRAKPRKSDENVPS